MVDNIALEATKTLFWEALAKRVSLQKRIDAWMNEEGRQGRLRRNSDCPLWHDYTSAADEETRLLNHAIALMELA